MTKINKPKGLIRYDSENNIAEGKKTILTGRVKAYIGILTLLSGIFIYLLFSRAPVQAIFLRMQGQRYEKVDENTFSNVYNFKLLNKTADAKTYHFELMEPEGKLVTAAGETIEVEASALTEGAVLIYLNKDQMEGTSTDLKIGVYQEGELVETVNSSFTGPLIKPKRQ
jgi:polyferredoxin